MNEELHPKLTARLIGHEAELADMKQQWESGKLAHGWLITGPRGIGKATMAYHFARLLLAGQEVGEEHPVFRRVAAGSHSDLLVVEPAFDEKKGEYANDINAEQAREISHFLSLTPGEAQWRVVIIDSVDALNTHGANAILKILEEPPHQSVILLISHNPLKLLPTIRSRCRVLRLNPLTSEQYGKVVRQAAPEVDSAKMKALGAMCEFSPGVALSLQETDAISLYEALLHVCGTLPEVDLGAVHRFADEVGTGKVHQQWKMLAQVALCLLSRAAKLAAGQPLEALSDDEGELLPALAGLHSPEVWAQKYAQAQEQFSLAERLHLDYKQVLIVFIHSLASREGLQLGILAA